MNFQRSFTITLVTLSLLLLAIPPVSADPLIKCIDELVQGYKEIHGNVPNGANYDAMVYTCHMRVYGKDPNFYTPEKDAEIDPEGIPVSDKTIYIGGSSDRPLGSGPMYGDVNGHDGHDTGGMDGLRPEEVTPEPPIKSGTKSATPTPLATHNHKVITCSNCGEKMIVCPTCNTVIPLATSTPKSNGGK